MGNDYYPDDDGSDIVDISSEIKDSSSNRKSSEIYGDDGTVSVKTFRKKKGKWIKWVVLLVVAVAVVIFFRSRSGQTSLAGYEQETVTRRDIKTYHSFTGNITPVTEEQRQEALREQQQGG